MIDLDDIYRLTYNLRIACSLAESIKSESVISLLDLVDELISDVRVIRDRDPKRDGD